MFRQMALALLISLSACASTNGSLDPAEVNQRMAEVTCGRLSECFATDQAECVESMLRHFERGSDWPTATPDEGQMQACEVYVESLSCDPAESSELWWSAACTF